jgi:hypothetical protein
MSFVVTMRRFRLTSGIAPFFSGSPGVAVMMAMKAMADEYGVLIQILAYQRHIIRPFEASGCFPFFDWPEI